MDYFNERDERNIEKTREICGDFPSFALEFFIGIQMRTSPLTRLNYAYDLRIFFDYLCSVKFKGKIVMDELTLSDLQDLTAFDIELFLEYLSSYSYAGKKYKCGEKAKQRKLATLRSFFKYYFKKDKLPANIAQKVDMPKIHDKPIVRLERNEVTELLNSVDTGDFTGLSKRELKSMEYTRLRDMAILTLLLGTGIRVSECVGLNIDDLDFTNNSFIITRKGGNKSILYFSEEVSIALKDYLDWLDIEKLKKGKEKYGCEISDNSALFVSLKGQRITTRAVEMLVKKYSKHVVPLKKITPHKLRSTYGTELYRKTQDIYIVADVLGHKDINTTRRHYAAMSEELRRDAAEKVKLRDKDDENINPGT